jgi:hypothetical protein
MLTLSVGQHGYARYVRLACFSFLILIGRFVTLGPCSLTASCSVAPSHPCTHLMITETPLRLAVD